MSNPYQPGSVPDDSGRAELTRLQWILLALLAITLFLRGALMVFGWAMQFSAGFDVRSHFYAAIFTKDAVYGMTALVGSVLLVARHRLGWWSALVHWSWYFACEIVVVATGSMLGWRVPVTYDPPILYRALAFSFILSLAGFAVLLWHPIAAACRAPTPRRYRVAVISLVSAISVAFAVNWWMSFS